MMRALLSTSILALALTGCISDGDVGYYERCRDTSDCIADVTCFRVAFERDRDGAMCTVNCEADTDCPGNAACFGLVGDPVDQKVCFQRCIDDGDCPPTFVCADAERDGMVVDAICLPE